MSIPTEITSALLGALVGAFITYRFALHLVERQHNLSKQLADREARRLAAARFRGAFAPTQAFIYIAQKHGAYARPDVDAHVKSSLLNQGAAVEEFRPFVKVADSVGYQQAWEEYRAAAASDIWARTAGEWGLELKQDQLLENLVEAIVRYAGA